MSLRQAAANNTSTSVASIKTQLDLDASPGSDALTSVAYIKTQLVVDASRRLGGLHVTCTNGKPLGVTHAHLLRI